MVRDHDEAGAEHMTLWHEQIWKERYGHVCPDEKGTLLDIDIDNYDAYNPAFVAKSPESRLIAVRLEKRNSIVGTQQYHPSIAFVKQNKPFTGPWHLDEHLPRLDMLEDPFVFHAKEPNGKKITVLGGVRIRERFTDFLPQTEFYKGESIHSLEPISFAVLHGLKDIRLLQLPDGRFLLCRRPRGQQFGRGRITLHVIDTLNDLVNNDVADLPTLGVLDSGADVNDWVGVNAVYLLTHEGKTHIGLLGHIAFEDKDHIVHYAACTYTLPLEGLLKEQLTRVAPHVIATRDCFHSGPRKTTSLGDVVFPGALEHVTGDTYRLWAGLSDTRVGVLEVDKPFIYTVSI